MTATDSFADPGRPLRLVTLDLYDTLIELRPPRWERMAAACAALGIAADPLALRAADPVAEDYYTVENGARPIRERSAAEREAFRVEHTARWLAAADLPHDRATAGRVRAAYLAEFDLPRAAADAPDQTHYRVFPDVAPALERLRAAGILTAIVSNADADVTAVCAHFDFAHRVDLIVTSALVGWEKPDPRTFRAALDALAVDPADALHIGDQPRSDIAGALSVGMRAALLDRYGRHPEAGVPTTPGLLELAEGVIGAGR
jgi:putative hydrolase of the HAD superfamily